MSDGTVHLLALAAAVVGMAAFSLMIDAHWRQVFGSRKQTVPVRAFAKLCGVGFLGLSFVLCAVADPVTMAMLVWPMLLGVAAAIVAAFFTVSARYRSPG